MRSCVGMIEGRKQILSILHYCQHRSIPLMAKSEGLIPIELKCHLMNITTVSIKSRVSWRKETRRELCLLMKLHTSSFNLSLPWPSRDFVVSLQHRTMGHSFHSELLRFVRRGLAAVFSFPEGIYCRRLREALRTCVDPSDNIYVAIRGEAYAVVNLAMAGAAILIPATLTMRLGQAIQELELLIGDCRFRARGRVRHISRCSPQQCLCGLSFDSVEAGAARHMREFIVQKQLRLAGIDTNGLCAISGNLLSARL